MPAEIPIGDPESVSSIVSYLVKPEASFITGKQAHCMITHPSALSVDPSGQSISPNGGAVLD